MTGVNGSPDGVSDGDAIALTRFWGPKYWPTWLLMLWFRITALLPWRVAVGAHKRIGSVAGVLQRRRRRVVRRNLDICFPQLSSAEISALTSQHFENVGAFIAETAIAWFGNVDRLRHLYRVDGAEHLQSAIGRGKGVLLFSGHFTALEICVPMIKPLVPLFAFMFRKRGNPLLNEIQRRGRRRAAHISVANDDVRSLLRMLGKNAVVWYAADRASVDFGTLLPFFGEPAMTSTATSRLARVSGAAIIPLFFCRLPGNSGYLLRFHAPLDDLPSSDEVRDTQRLTKVLEEFVRECPEQYFWIHRRFKGRPSELPEAYEE
jgi:Kdo2-lipid IVA lauroyltransferase/acyltransferase